jgi:hypothetical protein
MMSFCLLSPTVFQGDEACGRGHDFYNPRTRHSNSGEGALPISEAEHAQRVRSIHRLEDLAPLLLVLLKLSKVCALVACEMLAAVSRILPSRHAHSFR